MQLNENKDRIELRGDRIRIKEARRMILPYNKDNVITKVALPFNLLKVSGLEGDVRRYMEHNLSRINLHKDRMSSHSISTGVQPSRKSLPILQRYFIPYVLQKLIKCRASALCLFTRVIIAVPIGNRSKGREGKTGRPGWYKEGEWGGKGKGK